MKKTLAVLTVVSALMLFGAVHAQEGVRIKDVANISGLEDIFPGAIHDPQTLTDLDFAFHLAIAIASGNLVYPLIINSFKGVYTNLTGEFFRKYVGSLIVAEVHQFHRQLVGAFELQDTESAVQTMSAMLAHGERYLKGEGP